MCNKTINGIWLTHDIKNYPDLGQCYLPNIDQGLDNSWYHAQPIIVYCFGIILTGPLIFVQLGPRLQPLTSAVGSHCLDDWATSHVTISRVLLNQQPLFFFLCFLVVISDELETRFAQFKEKKLLSQLSDPAWAEWHHAHLKENREEYKKLLREDWGSWNTKQDVSSVLHFWENECWCSLGHELYMVEQWFSISSVYYVLRIQGRIKLCAHQPGPTPKHFHFPATFPRKLLKKKSVNLVNVFVE